MFANSPALDWVKGKDFSAMSTLNKFNVSVIQNSTMGKDHDINCDNFPAKDTKMTNFEEAMIDILNTDPN